MAKVTLETVRLRLKELHPDVHTSASVGVWSHGGVNVHLSLHPKCKLGEERQCWSIFTNEDGSDETLHQEARVRRALRKALALAEAGQWDKPAAVVVAELMTATG